MRPLRDHIVVRQDVYAEASATLYVPQRRPSEHFTEAQAQLGRSGTVIATGPGRRTKHGRTIPISVKPGDKIMWEELLHPTTQDGHIIITERDITAVIEE